MSNMSFKISSCLEMLKITLRSLLVRSQLKVNSKQCQTLPFGKIKWSEILRTRSIYVFPCYIQFLDWSKLICEQCSLEKSLVVETYIKEVFKKKFTSETIIKGIQWKLFGVDGIAQLHLEDLHTRIWCEIVYLIPYFILYEI